MSTEQESLELLERWIPRILGVPFEIKNFQGGCPLERDSRYGLHIQPPTRTEQGEIVLYNGRCNTHGHEQYIEVREIAEGGLLIAFRNPQRNIAEAQLYVFGLDGMTPHHPYIARVFSAAQTVREALEALKPKPIREAEQNGIECVRQGDWWFYPVSREPKGIRLEECELWWPLSYGPIESTRVDGRLVDRENRNLATTRWTRHYVAGSICLPKSPKLFVQGRISAPDHEPLLCEVWHRAVHNRMVQGPAQNQNGLD